MLGLFGLSLVVRRRVPGRRTSGVASPSSRSRYLRNRNFVFPIAAQSFSNFAYLGAFFLTPLLLEESFGYLHNQSAVGFLSLPRPIVFSTIAPFAGYLAVRVGERTLAVVGTSAVVLSMGVFALAGHSTGLALVEFALVLSGMGLGVASPSLSATVSNQFAPEDLGTAAASQQLMNQVGTVAGIQVMETVYEAALRGHTGRRPVLHAFHLAYLVGGAVALLGVVAAARSRSTETEVWRRRSSGSRPSTSPNVNRWCCPRGAGAARSRAPRSGDARQATCEPPAAGSVATAPASSGPADRGPMSRRLIHPTGGNRIYAVISRSRLATSWACSSGGAPWSIMSLAMSPSTLTLPAMKACMPTWGFPSTRIALAVA